MINTIWISWENHRRTTELTKHLKIPLFVIKPNKNYFIKVVICSLKTIRLLLLHRPKKLFIQNPSILLNLLACWLKPIFKYKLIVDRHSNFKLYTEQSGSFTSQLFHKISQYTVKNSDLIIVTNDFLKELVEDWGGESIVLQDALPTLPLKDDRAYKLKKGNINIVFVCTYADDEPLDEVKEACKANPSVNFYITGKPKNTKQAEWPNNVILTGFLQESEYQSLLNDSDIILVLTTIENLLLCGAYEAVSLKKPLITSNTKALVDYFYKGCVYCDNSAQGISDAIVEAIECKSQLEVAMLDYGIEIQELWNKKLENLLNVLKGQ